MTDECIIDQLLTTNSDEYRQCAAIRHRVFVEEQHVDSSIESDGLDATCVHLAATIIDAQDGGRKIVGTCRLHEFTPFVKLERVAVLAAYRNCGIGSRLNAAAIRLAVDRWPHHLPVVHAQISAQRFYEKIAAGLVAVSDCVFLDANIEHRTMILTPNDYRSIGDQLIWKSSIASAEYGPGEVGHPDTIERIRALLSGLLQVNYF
jgi:predicted GNAT family N-acyltransferase